MRLDTALPPPPLPVLPSTRTLHQKNTFFYDLLANTSFLYMSLQEKTGRNIPWNSRFAMQELAVYDYSGLLNLAAELAMDACNQPEDVSTPCKDVGIVATNYACPADMERMPTNARPFRRVALSMQRLSVRNWRREPSAPCKGTGTGTGVLGCADVCTRTCTRKRSLYALGVLF